MLKHILIGIFTGAVNGVFGAGGGTIAVPAMEKFLKIEARKAHATAVLIILPLCIISPIFYLKNDFIDWNLVLKVVPGGMLGGYIGAKLLNICPKKILKKAFGIFMIIAAFRMVFS